MKKILIGLSTFILLTTLLSSCQTYHLTDRNEEIKSFAFDFRKYADKGFLFMPDEYYGEYEVKGIIRVEMHPSVRYKNGEIPGGKDYYVHHFFYDGVKYTQMTKSMDVDKLIEHIYDIAIDWGGDAFTHFDSNIQTARTDQNPNTTYSYYSISGVVIKRK
ncbi:MAG: hypothetical protein K9I94_14520 [Bacteroidales bacterium]|nr:hypothetical protein [Bacteroidales bacterium]